ncbi:MAG: aminoglycoside 6-N-acetyltransferase [Thermoanaerobaculia bacterium]|jgi:aminoglycoside 6'-N-acetyltransferase I|nr:aminoglycoside 6-N-acetyltransferase [Thermoanaerobaculia bacterium]
MNVRPVNGEDRDAWLRMRAALWPEESGEELADEIDHFLKHPTSSTLSAVFVSEHAEGQVTGFIELFLRNYAEGCVGVTPYIEAWFVEPAWRGRGVGKALMEAAESWSANHGFRELASDTELENEASQQAHRACGFDEVERIVIFRKAL